MGPPSWGSDAGCWGRGAGLGVYPFLSRPAHLLFPVPPLRGAGVGTEEAGEDPKTAPSDV